MKKTMMWTALAVAVAAGPALAQSTGTGTQGQGGTGNASGTQSGQSGTSAAGRDTGASGSTEVASSDRRFMEDAARSSAAEVKLGQLAQQKAESSEVKAFAKQMVEDHSAASEQLKSIAGRKGVTLPSDPGSDHKSMQERLEKLSGAEFDRAYVQGMVKEHKKDVSKFQKASQDARDGDVKQFASQALPKLQKHLEHAQQLDKSVSAKSPGQEKDDRPASGSDPSRP